MSDHQTDMIAKLTFMLERVKSGEITNMALAAVDNAVADKNVYIYTATDNDLFTLLGAVCDLRRTVEDKIQR